MSQDNSHRVEAKKSIPIKPAATRPNLSESAPIKPAAVAPKVSTTNQSAYDGNAKGGK